MQISQIDNVAENTRRLVKAGKLDGSDTQIKLMLEGNTNLRVRTIEKKLKGSGVTVAELMLVPGIQTEWYKEASVGFRCNLSGTMKQVTCRRYEDCNA